MKAHAGIDGIPHAGVKAEESFQFEYLFAPPHRAFAIAPGGAWSWQAGKETTDAAKKSALEACGKYTQQKCVLYAVDNEIVFDAKSWSSLWGPYKTGQQAFKAATGVALGEKFPDIKFTDPAGVGKTLSQLRGKVVFIHFWGCWCASCRYEFVSLIDMYRILRDVMGKDVEFVVLQMREPITQAKAWAKENNLSALPLSDSGVKSSSDTELTLRSGKKIQDRDLAKIFPASYVLDKHGIVIFSHMGSVSDWSEYVPFFRDAVSHSGK
ncbi:MAG: hypothetical protein QG652_1146 [Pseudomonadota bacterium]|nr:hypothetical protein [Pseudomonadota bacterium]